MLTFALCCHGIRPPFGNEALVLMLASLCFACGIVHCLIAWTRVHGLVTFFIGVGYFIAGAGLYELDERADIGFRALLVGVALIALSKAADVIQRKKRQPTESGSLQKPALVAGLENEDFGKT